MEKTKIFRNGHSQAVRIPKDLAYERWNMEMEIERIGDEIRIRPAKRRLSGLLRSFSRISSDFMVHGRGTNLEKERNPL